MTKQTFNLVSQPWIYVLDTSGDYATLSLQETFRQSQEIASVSGELPTQDFAIVRTLLAIGHRAVGGPRDEDHWFEIWENPESFIESCLAYLDTWEHKFDLFDSTQPFYQISDLCTSNPKEKGSLHKLIASVPDNFPLFTSHFGTGLESISPAEAARWLIHLQAYDTAGIKTGMVGDPRVKQGKGYSIGTGWVGNLGGILIEGKNLLQTLLLNLVPMNAMSDAYDFEDDLPVWEREPQTSAPEGLTKDSDTRTPMGKVDLYTWQVRRVRLTTDEQGNVTNALVGNGDKIIGHNKHVYEPLSGWRYSVPQSQKYKTDVYMPKGHDPTRRLWRGLQSIVANTYQTDINHKTLQASNLSFLRSVQEFLDMHGLLRIRAYGFSYGSQSAIYEDCFNDSIVAPTDAYTDPVLGNLILDAVSSAEKATYALADFAKEIAYAAGASPKDSSSEGLPNKVRTQAFEALETDFRQWLRQLDPTMPEAALTQWRTIARRTISDIARKTAEMAGPTAMIGREITIKVNGKQEKKDVSTARAELSFYRKLKQFLPKEQG